MRRNALTIIGGLLAPAALVGLTIAGCAGPSQWLPMPEELAERGAVPASTDAASLRRGRALAVTECMGCHRFFWPSEHPPRAWRGIARSMGDRASLSRSQIEELVLYLAAASRVAREARGEGPDVREGSD